MAKKQFRLTLVSGPPNIRKFLEKASQTYAIGDLVSFSTGIKKMTGTIESGIAGVAVKKGANATTGLTNLARVSVITPEQVWSLHCTDNVKPTALTMLDTYKLKYTSTASFNITRLAEATSTSISVKGPVILSTAATGTKGALVVGFADGLGTKKGQMVLVRFTEAALHWAT